jgi:hypothetical protein
LEPKHARTARRHNRKISQQIKLARYPLFAQTLDRAMKKTGQSPSDVARKVWGTVKNKRGYDVARNRDRMSHYLAGTSFPTPDNLVRLAEAVGVSPEDLALDIPPSRGPAAAGADPNLANPATAAPRRTPASIGTLVQTSLPAEPGKPGKVLLDVYRAIPWKLAEQINALLKEAETQEIETNPHVGEVIAGTDTTQ